MGSAGNGGRWPRALSHDPLCGSSNRFAVLGTDKKREVTMSDVRYIRPEGLKRSPAFSPAVLFGRLLFVSGQVAVDERGNVVGIGDCKAQAEQVMQNLATVLESAGGGIKDIIKITTFLVNRDDYGAFNEVRRRFFQNNPPASSTVIVGGLVRPEYLIEVEAIAVIQP